MAAQFGALTDHFGILAIVDGEGTLADKLELIDASKTPDAMSRADAPDANGDIAASTWYGNTAGALAEASGTFLLKSGTLSSSLLKGGELAVGKTVLSVAINTSNGDWPKIVISGKLGTEAITEPTGKLNTWTFPEFSIVAAKRAQELAFTTGADCSLTDSSISGSLDLAMVPDGVGEPAAHGISGGPLTMGATFTAIEAAASWTLAGDWTETQAPGAAEGQAAYHTATATAEMIWERDTSA